MVWLLRLCGLLRGRSGKAIVVCVMSLSAAVAIAAGQCTEYLADYGPQDWKQSPEEACRAAVSAAAAANPQSAHQYTGSSATECRWDAYSGGDKTKPRVPGAWAIYSRAKEGDCDDKCKGNDGRTQVVNFTVGWARSGEPDTEDHVGRIVFPRGKVCVDKCTWQVTDNGITAYRSVVPSSQGLHRLSVDFTLMGDASSACEASTDADKAADPNQPPKQCPGYVGEVNGKTVCVGSASKPVESPQGLSAGRQSGAGEDTGNPSAGKKPSSGEGSGSGGAGRTPTAGNGENPGGPAGAVGGGKPNGTTAKPGDGKEQAACGAPGQPKCRLDESGTPDGKSAFDGPAKSLDDAFNKAREQLDGIKSTGDKDTSWGIVPSWLQHGGCTPWVLGVLPLGEPREIKLDVCAILPYVEAVTSFLWAIGTFVATLAMVFRVTTASKG